MVLIALAFLTIGQSTGQVHNLTVHGTILGADGNPVPYGIVGAYPSLTPDATRYQLKGGVTADANGKFKIAVKIPYTRFELSAFNADQTEGGHILESEKNAGSAVIKLAPIYPVAYEFVIPPVLKKDKFHLTVALGEGEVWVSDTVPTKGTVRLPQGKNAIVGQIFGEVNRIIQPFTVTDKPLTLPVGKFKLTPFALKYGKPALPLLYNTSRGLKKPFQWKDYRGKWVFVEQWAYWCVTCCFESLPRLMKFVADNKDQRHRLAVVTIHTVPNPDSNISNFKTLKPMLNVIQEKAWKGKPLPFPILLDLEGRTMKSWGFTSADVQFLVDPQGNIVRGDPYEILQQNGFK